ncbi:hypothetical protein BN946_scf184910.g27 [Trametes cinnabarina]|uniref:Uncharacterized protein n=1 Tax=Pycnoporus cinnabarinus TaxID=5643 RepID=A0A060SGH6_PYCCI|nr:hypothetical protein BN946_scf184910.g27 [Trametes cinnabarina]
MDPNPEGHTLPVVAATGQNDTVPTDSDGSPQRPEPVDATQTTPRAPWRSPWRAFLVFMGYTGGTEAECRARQRRVSLVMFLISALVQVLVVVLLTAAAATNKSPQPEHPGQTEFGACNDLAILNLIWLGRVLFVVYLLFWARWIKRVLTRRRYGAQSAAAAAAALDARGEVDLEASAVQSEPSRPTFADYLCPINVIQMHILIIKLSPILTLV